MQGKRVLITGGAGGLGMGVTPVALAQGAEVTIPYVGASAVERFKGILSPADLVRLRFVAADLSSETEVEQLIHDMGQVDVVLHLVGGFSMGATHNYDYSDWQQDLNLNLNTTFLVCKHSLKMMRQTGYGRIVTIGSRGALEPAGHLAAYCAAKAGVVALTRAIADEMKGTNITANCVLPSVIDTPTNRDAMGSENADQWVKPESLAETICFLGSEAAGDIRGAAIPVYGNA